MTFPIYSAGGVRLTSLAQWQSCAGPKGGSRQWKALRSALELASAWAPGVLPVEIEALLASNKATRGFEAHLAVAECPTQLDEFKPDRSHDLIAVGCAGDRQVLLTLEGKADESFGELVDDSLQRAKKQPRSNLEARMKGIAKLLFGSSHVSPIRHLRYQLLHATAAALLERPRRNCAAVAFIVHEFRSDGLNPAYLQRNTDDLDRFVEHLTRGKVTKLLAGKLVGPLRVGKPAADLFVGKAFRRLPAPQA